MNSPIYSPRSNLGGAVSGAVNLPTQTPPVPRAVDLLGTNVSTLHGVLDTLEKRLGYVSSLPVPAAGGAEKACPQSSSPHGHALYDAVDSISGALRRLGDILERLEI